MAQNQTLFREVNERIAEIAGSLSNERVDAVCECGDTSCAEILPITIASYNAVRAHGDRFVLVPGHEDRAIERVLERSEQWVVVEKIGEAGDVARELDPR